MPEVLNRDSQECQVFDYCVNNRRNTNSLYVTYHLSDGWSLIQYKAPTFIDPTTPVWAIWNSESDDEKHCFVIYGDPHLVYLSGEQEMGKQFITTAKLRLGNKDVVYFSGSAAGHGQLSKVYIRRSDVDEASIVVWGQDSEEPPTPELTGEITMDGLTLDQ